MYIKHLELKQFCNVPQASLEFADATVLFGQNGHGKSTVLYAVQMLLFGYCPRTARNGAGSDRLIRDGAKQAEVSADIVVNSELSLHVYMVIKRRGSNEWGCVEKTDGTIFAEQRADLWHKLGISMRHASVAAFPAEMLLSKDLGDILADYLASDIDVKRLAELCGADNYEWLQEFAKSRLITLGDANSYEQAGQAAYARRTDIKKDLTNARTLAEAASTYDAPKDAAGAPLTVEHLPKLRAQLDRMQMQARRHHEELGEARAAVTSDEITAKRDDLNARRTDAEHVLAVANSQAETAATEHNLRLEQKNAAEQRMSEANAAEKNAAQALTLATRAVSLVPAGCCPTCNHTITQEEREAIVGPLQKSLDAAKKAHDAAFAEHDRCMDAANIAREVEKKARAASETCNTKQRDAQRVLDGVNAQLAALPAAYTGPSVADIQAQIDMLDAQIAKCAVVVESLEKRQEYDKHIAYIAHAEAEVERLDWCVKAFKDGAVLKQLLGSPLDEFCTRCNAELAPLGYELSIHAEGKALAPMLRCPGASAARPVLACSTGQQTLVAVSIAAAFADTGAPVLIDDLNHLDADNRRSVLSRMRAKAAGSVICAATWQMQGTVQAAQAAAGALAPVAVYWVEKGAYSAVGAAQQAAA